MNKRKDRETLARHILDNIVSEFDVTPGGDKLYIYENVIKAMLWFHEQAPPHSREKGERG